MTKFRTLDDIDVRGKRALTARRSERADENGTVTDTTRIDRLAPTIESPRSVCEGHRDVAFWSAQGSERPRLFPLAAPLSRAIGRRDVAFAEHCIGDEKRIVSALQQPSLLSSDCHTGCPPDG